MHHDPETVRRLLERDLIEWADDGDLRLVWADLLQLEGDPLGTLVVLDHTAATAPAEVAAAARAEAQALRERLAPRLWDQAIPANPGVELIWQRGFVRELVVTVAKLSNEHTPKPARYDRGRRQKPASRAASAFDTVEWLIPLLLRQPALRWIEVVRIEVPDVQAHYWSGWLRTGYLSCPTLREVHIGQPPTLRKRPAGAWEPGGGDSPTRLADQRLASFARLRWLSFGGRLARLPCRDGSSQTRVHHVRNLARRPLTSSNRASLCRALWDASVLVHQAAFEVGRELGPAAEFMAEDLALFLRPPIGKKDPRPAQALRTLAAIGPAGARVLPEVLARPDDLLGRAERSEALLDWWIALGPAAAPYRKSITKLVPKARRAAVLRALESV